MAKKILRCLTLPMRATARAATFFLKVFPMLPSRPVDWVTPAPVIEKIRYPTQDGFAEGDLYRPNTPGPYPGILVCLGVVPFEVDHPQVPVLGNALARAGFAALLYWSPSMRDFRLDPLDNENLPLAYRWLIDQPNIDPARSGLLGTCVGGSFALMAAAHPLIQDQVAFVGAYAPFSSMWTFATDIASQTRDISGTRQPWPVDQLTRRVFVHSLTALLDPAEADWFRSAERRALAEGGVQSRILPPGPPPTPLSLPGQLLYDLLAAPTYAAATDALRCLPPDFQQRLTAMSPLTHLSDASRGICAPLITLLHDRSDNLIPISESRQLLAALKNHPGIHYTEMNFSHLDPTKGRLPLGRLLREFAKFYRAVYPIFSQTS